jgi:hypothetical protein
MVAGFGKQTYYSNEQNLGEDVRTTSNETLIEHLNIKNCHRSWRWLWIKTYIIYQFISHRYPSQSLQSKKNMCKIHCAGPKNSFWIRQQNHHAELRWTLIQRYPKSSRTWSCWRMPIVRLAAKESSLTWHESFFGDISWVHQKYVTRVTQRSTRID